MRWLLSIVALSLALPAAAEPGDPVRGKSVFLDNCAVCHGLTAEGDGPMADVLTVPPPDLTGLTARAGGTFPATYVTYRIDGRTPLVSHGGDMPIFGRLFDLPDGSVATESGQPVLTAQPIADAVAWLRTIQD